MHKWIRQGFALLVAMMMLGGCMLAIGPDKPPVRDRDGNKIYDDLDALLKQAAPDEPVPVLVMMDSQPDTVRILEEEVDVKYRYDVVPAVAASMTKEQVLAYARENYVRHIEHDAEVRAMMGTASQWFGATKARQDFGVTGDRDGNPTSYSTQDVVVAVIDTGKSITYRT